MTTINAQDLIAGRLATEVSKRALQGEKIDIVNSEKAIITGKKDMVINRYREKKERGHPFKGPFLSMRADKFLRRIIRGMLPYKQEKGKRAFKNIMCYLGIPEELESKKLETIKNAHITKSKTTNFITVEKLCKSLKK